MHSTGYDVEGERCRVHHDSDCTGDALFHLIGNDGELTDTVTEDISIVEDSVILAEAQGSGLVMIGDVCFSTKGVSGVLAEMAMKRMQSTIDSMRFGVEFRKVKAIELAVESLQSS